jgi:large subunit ribosomal protein L29
MTKATELRELNDGELIQKLAEAKEEHFNLRFQSATGSSTTAHGSATSAVRSPDQHVAARARDRGARAAAAEA